MIKFKTYLTETLLKGSQKDTESNMVSYINDQGYAVLTPAPGIGSGTKPKIRLKENLEKYSSLDTLPGQHSRDPSHDYQTHSKKRNSHYNKISQDLSKAQHTPTDDEKHHIKAFTTYSGVLNKKLIKNHQENKPDHHGLTHSDAPKAKWDTHEKTIHEHIKKLGSKPIGKELHVYSGVGFDPAKAAKASKNNTLHSPAHISTSHDIETAHEFTREHNTKDDQGKRVDHIMHIHLKPTDKGYHIGKKASAPNRDQNETVLPAGTKLKYSHTTQHDNGYGDANHYAAVHHFTIHT